MKRKIASVLLLITSILITIEYFGNILKNDKIITINNKNIEENLLLEQYIIGVVACEMPALYEEEALKSQAIASRTYALYKANNNMSLLTTTDDQCYITEEEMKEKWKKDFEKYYSKIKKIVNETKSIVMYKEEKLFKSFYFSTSNGMTEESQYVFKEENLKSVESPWDKNSKNYKVETIYSKKDLVKKLGNFNIIEVKSRNNTNHIEYIKVDDKTYTGIEFRKLIGLRSTDFTIESKEDNYIFTTYGYGHGVGMSQYGANELAKLGYNYEYILNYFYSGVEFKNIMYNL